MPRLRDILLPRPKLLLVGINPGAKSWEAGHHFASAGNPFWRLLHTSGLTPVLLKPEEEARLKDRGIAMTNLCPRMTRRADELTPAEIRRGAKALDAKVRRLRPALVAFVGVSIYRAVFPASTSKGAGPKPELWHGAKVFALPNPSGLNASYPGFKEKLVWFRALARRLPA